MGKRSRRTGNREERNLAAQLDRRGARPKSLAAAISLTWSFRRLTPAYGGYWGSLVRVCFALFSNQVASYVHPETVLPRRHFGRLSGFARQCWDACLGDERLLVVAKRCVTNSTRGTR